MIVSSEAMEILNGLIFSQYDTHRLKEANDVCAVIFLYTSINKK